MIIWWIIIITAPRSVVLNKHILFSIHNDFLKGLADDFDYIPLSLWYFLRFIEFFHFPILKVLGKLFEVFRSKLLEVLLKSVLCQISALGFKHSDNW